jgi:hypothetical protein
MIDWQEIAAFGALGIGVVNAGYSVWDARRKPVRDEQRQHRATLREILVAVEKDCFPAREALHYGRDLPEVPASIKEAQERLEKLEPVLLSPGEGSLTLLETVIDSIEGAWERALSAEQNPDIYNERERAAKDMQLKGALDEHLEVVREYRQAIFDMDNGPRRKSRRAYRRYQSGRKRTRLRLWLTRKLLG